MTQQTERNYSPIDEDLKLWKFLGHATYVISRLREFELAEFGLTPEQVYVLDILDVNGGTTTIGQIVDMTLRPHHTVSTLIARMAKRGLLKKKRNTTDKRSYEIIITRDGQDLFGKVTRKSIQEAFSILSKDDKRELGVILARLLDRGYELSGKQYDFTQESIPCSF